MSHASLIDKWPSLTDFASDLGLSYGTAKAMRRRGSIPPEYWAALVTAAAARKIEGVTYEALAAMAAQKRRPAEPPLAQAEVA